MVVRRQRIRDVGRQQAAQRVCRRELMGQHGERCDAADVILHAVTPHRGVRRERAQRNPLQELPAGVPGRGPLAVVVNGGGQERAALFREVDLAAQLREAVAHRIAAQVLEIDQIVVAAVAATSRALDELCEGAADRQRAE